MVPLQSTIFAIKLSLSMSIVDNVIRRSTSFFSRFVSNPLRLTTFKLNKKLKFLPHREHKLKAMG